MELRFDGDPTAFGIRKVVKEDAPAGIAAAEEGEED